MHGPRLGLTWIFAVMLTAVTAAADDPRRRPCRARFPGATPPPPPATKPADPAAPAPTTAKPAPGPVTPNPASTSQGGAAAFVYPGAEFLSSFDAGRDQRFYLYGTNAPFAEIVQYYKGALKAGGGRELMKTPAMQQFDIGRFDEDTMAYPPSVVVKDYTWNNSAGYLFVNGTTEKRFKTIIQIVPPRISSRSNTDRTTISRTDLTPASLRKTSGVQLID